MKQLHTLTDYLHFSKVYTRNKLLFSLDVPVDKEHSDMVRSELINTLSCLLLEIPPLRTYTEDLSNLCTLYINEINKKFGKHVLNFEVPALKYLVEYRWPSNFRQFKRILKELIISADTSYISLANLKSALLREQGNSYPSDFQQGLDLKKPLNELTEDIVSIVVKEENGNKTKAAKRLGIARNTLWRILNK
jgi:transcriptional regulator with PAS, ATPase and Fis domain